MPTEPVDIPGLTSEAPPEPTAQPVEAPPETIAFKVRGEERNISASSLDTLASELGTSRDAALMWLQSGKDYAQHVTEMRQRERELAEYESQLRTEYERFQQERKSQPQTAPQAPDPGDDPMAYLKLIAQKVSKIDDVDRKFAEREQYWENLFEQQRQLEEAQKIESAYENMAKQFKDKYPTVPVPSYQEVEQECLETGMAFNKRLTWEKAMWKAAQNLSFDAALQARERSALERLREPKAQVVVPGAGTAQAPKAPQAPTLENQLANIKWGDVIESIPEARR